MIAGVQVVACEIEEFMRDFSQPWFERAGVADKVIPPAYPAQPCQWNLPGRQRCQCLSQPAHATSEGPERVTSLFDQAGSSREETNSGVVMASQEFIAWIAWMEALEASVMHGAVQVDVRLGPASETLDRLAAEGKRFDLAFLDADKTGYMGYYKKVVPPAAIWHADCPSFT